MNRVVVTSFCAILAVAVFASGQTTPAITVGGSAFSGDSAGRVLLALPIEAPSSGKFADVSQSIQQDLVADLSTLTAARVIAPASARPATNEQSAIDQGRQNNADFVIWGQAQASGNQMRVTGQLLRVSDGHVLAGLKATAPTDNLFPLEDSLAAQVARALPAPIGLVTPPPQTQPAEQGGYTSQPQPLPTVSTPATDSGNPYYSYTATVPQTYYSYNTYYSPGYWSPYWDEPYLWGGIGFYGGFWPYHYGWYNHGGYGGHFFGRPYGYGYRGGYGGGFRGGYGGGHGGGGGGGGHR